MSIVDWFKNDLNTEERVLTRDLLSVAVADKEFSDEEKRTIVEICQLEGITKVDMMDSIREENTGAKLLQSMEEKKRYLLQLVKIMMADGKYYALEIHVIEVLARKIEVSPLQLLSFILDEVNAGHISKEEGIRVIDHLIRRYLA